MKMNPEIKKKWIEALRSGKYQKGREHLRYNNEYCCLGILCELAVEERITSAQAPESGFGLWAYDQNHCEYLPFSVQDWALLNFETQKLLSSLNDKGRSFKALADFIEEYL